MMSLPLESLPDIPPEIVADVKQFIRIEHSHDDDAIDDFVRSAASLCEAYIGQLLISRAVTDMLPAVTGWQKLSHIPVQSINEVVSLSADGMTTALPVDGYMLDIDSDGIGWVRIQTKSGISRIRVHYMAGLGADWDTLPQVLRQGIVRLAGYLYSHRDGVAIDGPPSAVTALWQSHRRLRLG